MAFTDYIRLHKLDYTFSRQNERVTITGGEGVLETTEERLRGGQWKIPDTVGHLSMLVSGSNIGAVRTPFHGKRVQIDGSPGVAVVIQLTGEVSAIARLAPFGGIALATKLLEEVAEPYSWRTGIEQCPPKLGAALVAAQDALWEAKTMPKPIP